MALECSRQVFISIIDKLCRGDDDGEEEEVAEVFRGLPDCIVIDIVSRLPIEMLVKCLSERNLGALMSSPDFVTLHVSRAKSRGPMLLLHDSDEKHKKKNLYVLTNYSMTTTSLMLRDLYLLLPQNNLKKKYPGRNVRPPRIRFSCQGVLLLVNHVCWPPIYYVLNPITQEQVIVQLKQVIVQLEAAVCALYYCPVDHLFKLLLVRVARDYRLPVCQYLVYTIKTQTWREIRTSTKFNLMPHQKASPAIVNGALHWIMYRDLQQKINKPHDPPRCKDNGIIVFKMDTEHIYAKPHPGRVCNAAQLDKEHRLRMNLLEKENNLCFCHLLADVPALAIDLWILEYYKKWAWNKSYNINLFPYGPRRNPMLVHWPIKLFYIHDDQLLFYLKSTRCLYFYDLRQKTLKKIPLPRKNMLRPFGSYIKTLLPVA